MNETLRQRIRGCAVGAAGDAPGMPLEFGPPRPANRLVREMRPGRLPAGTFTDDTEPPWPAISRPSLPFPSKPAERNHARST
jgi:hypothetical protein